MLGENGALLVLLGWFPLGIALLSDKNGTRAALIVMLGGILLLPAAIVIDLPSLPGIGKNAIVSLTLLVGILLFHSRRARTVGLGTRGLDWVTAAGVPLAFATVFTNRDALPTDRGLVPWDAAGEVFEELTLLAIPFWAGRIFFRDSKDLKLLYVALLASAAAYSLLALVEVRMSPQINRWVYGYRQHSWMQVRRFGGWRPMVFMSHGLAVALYLAIGTVAGFVAYKTRLRVAGFSVRYLAWFVGGVVVLCKSLAAIVYMVVFSPLVFLARPRTIARVGLLTAIFVVAYPVMRATDVFPTGRILEAAAAIDESREQSLAFRFNFEDEALARAMRRPWFGWGGFGRATHREGETRNKAMIIDGYWVLRLGRAGVFSLVVYLLAMTWPVYRVARAIPRIRDPDDARQLAGLGVILALFALDTLPNALNHHFPLMIAGAMITLSTTLQRAAPAVSAEPETSADASPPEPDLEAQAPPSIAAGAPTSRELAKGRRRGA